MGQAGKTHVKNIWYFLFLMKMIGGKYIIILPARMFYLTNFHSEILSSHAITQLVNNTWLPSCLSYPRNGVSYLYFFYEKDFFCSFSCFAWTDFILLCTEINFWEFLMKRNLPKSDLYIKEWYQWWSWSNKDHCNSLSWIQSYNK